MSLTTSQKHLNIESEGSLQAGHKRHIGCAITYLILGIIFLFFGVFSIKTDFLEVMLNERIQLRPGLPPFEKWKDPSQVDLGVRVFIFAIENPDEFLANTDAKLKLKEIGPIYYKRTILQDDIVFHDEDSTMSYSTNSKLEFIEEKNEPGILNKSIVIINPVLMGLAAMLPDKFVLKLAFDYMAKKDHVFMNKTVYETLWNSTSYTLELIKKIPFAVPRPNAGAMFNSFYPSPTRYNVNIGSKHGFENFFKINTLNGKSQINVYEENFPQHCPYSLKGAREGTGFPPGISKDTIIHAYNNNLCRTFPMIYNRTVKIGIIDTYEFVFAPDIYKRVADPDLDCQRQTGGVILPNGLIDSSKCAFGAPVALSNPHFWSFHGEWENYLEGLNPQLEEHSSRILVEPTTGIQLDAVARIQSNIPLPPLDFFTSDVKRFSKMILPQFWIEYYAHNRDPATHAMIILCVHMSVIQPIIAVVLLSLSILTIYKAVKLMTALNFGGAWHRGKTQKTVYPTASGTYIHTYGDDSERTAL